MSTVIDYHPGGFDPTKPNGNKASMLTDSPPGYTAWDAAGNVIEQRPLTAEEEEALGISDDPAPVVDAAPLLDAVQAATTLEEVKAAVADAISTLVDAANSN